MTEDSLRVESYRVFKIPPFWCNAPEALFIQIEALFRVANISVERTKVDYFLALIMK